jgi:hypothetical protein
LLHIKNTDTAVNERAGFGHRNRLKQSKVARVDKKGKKVRENRGLHLDYCSKCVVVKALPGLVDSQYTTGRGVSIPYRTTSQTGSSRRERCT